MTVSRILDQKGCKVFTVDASASLQAVVDRLAEHRVGVLVVVDAGGRLAGIVSERDVIRALAGAPDALSRKTAADAMTRSLETCTPEDAESEIMARMDARGVRHLPVLADGKLAGLVSMRDVVKLRIEKIEEMMQSIRREAAALK